ncbi:hypothetical protein MRB53_040734 [Persea americana]|nr:hypothetical protein MRB53_040734 [Persea americana]
MAAREPRCDAASLLTPRLPYSRVSQVQSASADRHNTTSRAHSEGRRNRSSSAPLLSASYFIGARCKPYNDDFMHCKTEANGKGEIECLKEGRKVTRCAASVLQDINKSCLDVFRSHWECLENNNQQLWQCRAKERALNQCVFDNLVRAALLAKCGRSC